MELPLQDSCAYVRRRSNVFAEGFPSCSCEITKFLFALLSCVTQKPVYGKGVSYNHVYSKMLWRTKRFATSGFPLAYDSTRHRTHPAVAFLRSMHTPGEAHGAPLPGDESSHAEFHTTGGAHNVSG
jgi:hypothetical protein